MSAQVKETVAVAELSKYGFKTPTGEYVNWSKNIKEDQKARVVPGASFELDLFVADSGKKYVNAVLSQVGEVQSPPKVVKQESHKVAKSTTLNKSNTDTMSKAEWQAKDQRISRQGCIQVAVQVMGEWDKAVELADKMLVYVNQESK